MIARSLASSGPAREHGGLIGPKRIDRRARVLGVGIEEDRRALPLEIAEVGPVLDELLTDAREAPTVAHVAFQSAALSLAQAGIQALKDSRK